MLPDIKVNHFLPLVSAYLTVIGASMLTVSFTRAFGLAAFCFFAFWNICLVRLQRRLFTSAALASIAAFFALIRASNGSTGTGCFSTFFGCFFESVAFLGGARFSGLRLFYGFLRRIHQKFTYQLKFHTRDILQSSWSLSFCVAHSCQMRIMRVESPLNN